MKTSLWLLTALLSSPLLSPLAHAQKVPDQHQVVPGERIGRVFIGDSRDTVRRRLGKPTATFKLNRGLISELWKSKTPGAYGVFHTLEVVYDNGLAVQIEATNPIFKTQNGFSIDNDPQDWEPRLGKPLVSPYYIYPKSVAKEGTSQQYFDWKRSGLAIETAAAGDVVENHTLIVHRKGFAVIRDPGEVKEDG